MQDKAIFIRIPPKEWNNFPHEKVVFFTLSEVFRRVNIKEISMMNSKYEVQDQARIKNHQKQLMKAMYHCF